MPSLGHWRLLTASFSLLVPLTDCLQQGGKNVCTRSRLTKVSDAYPSDWRTAWDCRSYYPEMSCDRIRSGEVDIESVYFVENILTCCPGWKMSVDDQACDEACRPGYFGENCALECRCLGSSNQTNCDAADGSCECLPGWTGRDCDQRCDPELGCSSGDITLPTCENGGTFHPPIESCLCKAGYDGHFCEISCPRTSGTECGQIRCESCIADKLEYCDDTSNSCVCKDGWTAGRYCTDPCPSGSNGHFCRDECCSGNGICSEEGCLCNDGYYGEECQEVCPGGTFGRDCTQECACPSSPSCDPVTGECSSCPEGFKGESCTERCSPTEWGPLCASTCPCNSACEVFSGQCEEDDEEDEDEDEEDEGDFPVVIFVMVLASACALLAAVLLAVLSCCLGHRRVQKRRSTANSTSNNEAVTNHERVGRVPVVNGQLQEVNEGRDNRNTIELAVDHLGYERNLPGQASTAHQYEDMEDVPTLPSRARLHGTRLNELNAEYTDMTQPSHYAHTIYTIR